MLEVLFGGMSERVGKGPGENRSGKEECRMRRTLSVVLLLCMIFVSGCGNEAGELIEDGGEG